MTLSSLSSSNWISDRSDPVPGRFLLALRQDILYATRDNGSVSKLAPHLLVGRDEPLARLHRRLDRSAAGARGVVLVAGESGIGKTELVRAATRDRPVVAWGTCVEDTAAPGFWPWSQAIEDLARLVGTDSARQSAGADAALIATIAPSFGPARSGSGSGNGSARDRFFLLDAVNRWLDALAAAASVVIALDDLQWADDSTLALVDFVARSPRPAPVCLIGCYRPDELNPANRGYLTRLAAVADHIQLGGLDREAVEAHVTGVAGPMPPAAVEGIYRR